MGVGSPSTKEEDNWMSMVYAIKFNSSEVDCLKACLIVKEYTQICGLDYSDTFSPMAKMAIIGLFIAMATICYRPFHHLDIKNLSPQRSRRSLHEGTSRFVAQRESGLVCKLHRSHYGFKQSPHA